MYNQPLSLSRFLRQAIPRTLSATARLLTSKRIHSQAGNAKARIHAIDSSSSHLQTDEKYDSLNSLSTKRNLSSSDSLLTNQSQVAILGSGISGLATAYYLTRKIPNIKIDLYESTNRLGGWLQSESVDIGSGRIILESGPRTLRYGTASSYTTAEMVQDLGIENELLTSPKDSIAAKNRYIYYPDHLVRMPIPGESLWGNINLLLSESVFKGIIPAFLEFLRPPRSEDLTDESVASFFSRRLGGNDLVNNIHSAIIHGIYAGDINNLSARSLFPGLWYMEKHFGSLLKGVFICAKNKIQLISPSDISISKEVYPKIHHTLNCRLKGAGVFSFTGGLEVLSRALEVKLRASPNVAFRMNHEVKSLQLVDDRIEIQTSDSGPSTKYSHVVSTLLPHQTSSLTSHLPSLAMIPTVTVMVVNLYYDSEEILPVHGFGYLIPGSISFERNPECALGVVFDSDTIRGQDTVLGTKLTVMMGGHWWNDFTSFPDKEEGARMAKAVLKRHLGIESDPVLVRVNLQKDCIPQYSVGHMDFLKRASMELGNFKGRLSVTGCGYRGVGVNDCIAAARDLVSRMNSGLGSQPTTGLEWVDEDLQQVTVGSSLNVSGD
ncbi:Protoporphyrinogen oxidase [Golovinomyces cichoracearum]|uniref:Protoporphyrinogen oxidase n=1 Tax=Golovinomyces cichoracearum TaxID=62708 RepID=A0A420HAN9_9PEZI|nr:Protoporphyrinogen oxidase [Golovinomyces cichoracearum]